MHAHGVGGGGGREGEGAGRAAHLREVFAPKFDRLCPIDGPVLSIWRARVGGRRPDVSAASQAAAASVVTAVVDSAACGGSQACARMARGEPLGGRPRAKHDHAHLVGVHLLEHLHELAIEDFRQRRKLRLRKGAGCKQTGGSAAMATPSPAWRAFAGTHSWRARAHIPLPCSPWPPCGETCEVRGRWWDSSATSIREWWCKARGGPTRAGRGEARSPCSCA